ncbi:unnamed protein product, partial [Prorocentrum cordatum]
GRRASFSDAVEEILAEAEGGARLAGPRTSSPWPRVPRGAARQAEAGGVGGGTRAIVEGLRADAEVAGTRGAERQPSPAPAKAARGGRASGAPALQAPRARRTSWGTSSTAESSPETDCSSSSPPTSALEDSEAEEVAEETSFAKTAQVRRIRRSVT